MMQESCNSLKCLRQLKWTLESDLQSHSTTYWALDHALPCEHSDPLCRPPSLITRQPDKTTHRNNKLFDYSTLSSPFLASVLRALVSSASALKLCGSWIASSDRIFRFKTIPACASWCTNEL